MTRTHGLAGVVIVLISVFSMQARAKLPAPPGKYIEPGWTDFSGPSFQAYDVKVGTYYFYWYCVKTGTHIIDPDHTDACTDHQWNWVQGTTTYQGPPKAPVFCWDEKDWHLEQLDDMEAAGIDFLMPVYWGKPGTLHTGENYWSWPGVQTLVKAMQDRESQGKRVFQIGLFYDTSTLRGVDMSTQAGKEQFYGTIRDFYSMVPPKYWLRLEGKVVVWMYNSAFPSKVSRDAFEFARQSFASDFGGNALVFVGDSGWRSKGGECDLIYSWGAAVQHGAKIFDVCAVGPGFDNSAIPGGGNPEITTPRNGGQYYVDSWKQVLSADCTITVAETWNEYHESTDIAHSFEHGRKYIDLTADYSARYKFKQRYTRAMYKYFLAREPDPEGWVNWEKALSGTTPAAARDTMLESDEAKARVSNQDYVTFLYHQYLGRDPDAGGLSTYVGLLKSGKSRAFVRDVLLDSAEAKSKVTDQDFVRRAYENILGREPASNEGQEYVTMLANGKTRAYVRDIFINSDEFRGRMFSMDHATLQGIFDFSGLAEAPRCGDGTCDQGEDCATCPDDCGCSAGEVCNAGQCVTCMDLCNNQGRECGMYEGCNCGSCPAAGDMCRHNVCQDGGCVLQDVTDNTGCDDNDPCTVQDHCVQGVCTGTPRDCDDHVPCTVDSCNPADGSCVHDKGVQPSCSTQGVCSAGARIVCDESTLKWVCDYTGIPGWQARETLCDGLDNDCDGTTDEGCVADNGMADGSLDAQDATPDLGSEPVDDAWGAGEIRDGFGRDYHRDEGTSDARSGDSPDVSDVSTGSDLALQDTGHDFGDAGSEDLPRGDSMQKDRLQGESVQDLGRDAHKETVASELVIAVDNGSDSSSDGFSGGGGGGCSTGNAPSVGGLILAFLLLFSLILKRKIRQ